MAFYFHLRHPRNDANKVIVVAITEDIKNGPYYLFEKEDRQLDKHVKLFPILNSKVSFEFYKNLRTEFSNETQRQNYLLDGKFAFNNKLLKEIATPDDEYSGKFF